MTALELFQQVHDLGILLTPLPDGTLHYTAPKATMTSALLETIRQHKPELHALVETWSERAAIAEYCGGLAREAAERLAWRCLRPRRVDGHGGPSAHPRGP